MSVKEKLLLRSNSKCELCSSQNELGVYEIPPASDSTVDQAVLVCDICLSQINDSTSMDVNHWRCLNDSIWSEHIPVQVVAWRQLTSLSKEGWAQDLIDQVYMDDETQKWASALIVDVDESLIPTKDSNGAQLLAGDSVTLIKDLVVKGANFTAKRGTMVRNISLTSNPKHVEGRVNGTLIVLVANFLKKA